MKTQKEDFKMKRFFAILLTLSVLWACVGCGMVRYTEPISVKFEGNVVDDFESERLLEILNGGEWEDGLCDCVNEFYLTLNVHKIGYSTGCNTFNNVTNGSSLVLDDQTAAEVEEILCSLFPKAHMPYILEGEVLTVSNGSITVKTELYDGLGIVVSTNFVDGYGYKSDMANIEVGDSVCVLYDGKVAESYPPQILTVYQIYEKE